MKDANRRPVATAILGWFGAICMLLGYPACSGKSAPPRPPAAGRPAPGVEELSRLDLLPKLRQSVEVGMVSSYDRTGGNDDGFTGKYSVIRKEPAGLVIADLEGPGMVTRFHTPSPTDDTIEFYFDGEAAPRISLKIPEMFDGTHAPFLAPLVGAGLGGRYSYVPLPFERSLKIMVKAETFHFIQINYARFPEGTGIRSFRNPASPEFLAGVERAGRLFASAGSDISSWLVEEGTKVERKAVRASLVPGGTVTLFDSSRPGRLVGLKLGPAEAFAGKDRDILIKMTWDGAAEPAVLCSVSDFFGYSFGDPAVRSLLLGTAGSMNYVYLPMPFERSARVELVSERATGPAVPVQAEIAYAGPGKAGDEGRFYARWRRENPTAVGTPFTYLRTTGRGHVVGVILQAQGLVPGQTPFFEGDDRAIIDGRLAIPGTGSEDSFNGGWYDVPGRWEGRRSYPLSGCLDYQKPLGRTGGYRWLIADSYAYDKSIDFTIEHAPEGNLLQTDYTGVTFFYSLDPPPSEAPLPAVEARRVSDPDRIVYVPGWTVPIHSSSLQNAVLEKKAEKIGDGWARFLSMRTKGEDIFGPHHISFICGVPVAGRYKVGIKAVAGPDQGIVQVYRNDVPDGEALNLYAEARGVSPVLALGVFEMAAGDNLIFLELVGKDARSKATGIGMDLVEIVFERVK